jgi:hypothetical protein
MQVFVKIATLAMVGITLQGCFSDLLNVLNHAASGVTICQEAISPKYDKWQTELGGEDNTTAQFKCVAKNLEVLTLQDALWCADHIMNETSKEDLSKEPEEEAQKEKATQWVTDNFVDKLEGNTTLQEQAKDCDDGGIKSEEVEKEYSINKMGVEFFDEKEKTMNANFNTFLVAGGVGMVLAAVAGIIHRRVSAAASMTEMSLEQESVLLEELENAK